MRTKFVGIPVCAIALFFGSFEGAAAVTDTAGYRAMIETDFAEAETFAFVDLAEAAGDADAAIAALDQLLIRNPGNSAAHLRIAELYDDAGNSALAEVHRDLAGLPPRTQVWGRATVGIAHDTNPTTTASDALITVFDGANNTFVQVAGGDIRSDEATTVSLDLNLVHGLSEKALLAAEVFVSGENYSATAELDSITMQTTIGPWFSDPGIAEGARIRPFVTIGSGMLDSSPYYGSVSGGFNLDVPVGENGSLGLLADVTYTDFSGDISPNFNANTLDNVTLRMGGQFTGQTAGLGYALYAYGSYAVAEADEESYIALRAGAFASAPLEFVESALGVPAAIRVGSTVDSFFYREPNAQFDPTSRRQDLWLGGQTALIFGVTEELDLTLGADYIRRFSNLDPFDSDGLRIYLEAGVNF